MQAKNPPRPSGLGRGLAAIIPVAAEPAPTPAASVPAAESSLREVSVELIEPMPGQPRTRFVESELDELAASIKEKGVLQPILVRAVARNQYQLIAGERRFQASKRAGLQKVPVLVKDVNESEAFQLALIENLQREDLNPVEIARAFKRLAEDYHLSHEEIAQRMGKDRSSITNYLRVLTLPPYIMDRVEDRTLSFGHARALASLRPPEMAALDMHKLVQGRISVREIEHMVARLREREQHPRGDKAQDARRGESTQIRWLRQRMEERLGLKVSLKDNDGRGKLTIEYNTLDELEGLLRLMGLAEN